MPGLVGLDLYGQSDHKTDSNQVVIYSECVKEFVFLLTGKGALALLGAALLNAVLQLFGGPSQSYKILRRVVVFAWNLGPQVEF